MTIKQLNPPLPLKTPRGDGLAHFLIDYGPDYDLMWTVFLDQSGECWTFPNPQIRAVKNETLNRHVISDIAPPRHQSRTVNGAAEIKGIPNGHSGKNGHGPS